MRLSKAWRGYPVALRPVAECDGLYQVLFCHQVVALIDLHHPHPRN